MGAVRDALRKPLREIAERRGEPAVAQTLRATTAATIAYVVALQLSSERAPMTAPLTALLIVQVTLFATIKKGVRRVVAVITGVMLAIGFSSLVGLRWWSLCIIILLALIVGRIVRVNEFVNEVAISAMLILGVAGSTATAWARVLDTLIGAVVGLTFNLLFAPPLWIGPAGESIEDLARRMRHLLARLAETVGSPVPVERTAARLEEARQLDLDIAEVDVSLTQAEESLRLNPRVREALLSRVVLRTGLDTLEVCAVLLRVMARSLADLSSRRSADEPLVPRPLVGHMEELLSQLGGALVSFSVLVTTQVSSNADAADDRLTTELEGAARSRETVARILLEHIQRNPENWEIFGALLAQVDRILEELAPEHRSQRLMDELDRHTREQRERYPQLAKLQQAVRRRRRGASRR